MEVMYELNNMDFSPRPTWLYCCWVPNLPAVESDTEPPVWHRFDYTGLLPSWKGQHFILIGIDTLDMDLISLNAKLLLNLSSVGLQNALYTIIVFHIAFLLIKEFPSQQIKFNSWPMLMIIHWSYYVPQASLLCLISALCWFKGSGSKPRLSIARKAHQIGTQNTPNIVYKLG